MGFMDALSALIGRGGIETRSQDDPNYPDSIPGEWVTGGGAVTARAGVRVDPETAMAYTPVLAAVLCIAETLGCLPLHVYRRTKPYGKERARDHTLYRVLHDEPNVDMTAQTLIETLTIHALVWKNAFAYLVHDDQERVIEIIPLLPDRTEPVRHDGALWFKTRVGGQDRYLSPRSVLHIPGPTLNGINGMSRIEQGRETIGTGIAAERYAGEYYENGIHPSGSVSHPEGIGPKAAAKLKRDVEDQQRGLDKSHRVIVLQEGATFNPFELDAEKSQMLQSRAMSVEDAGRLFRVPSILLNHTKDSNYSIGETTMRHFLTMTIKPWGRRFEREIQRKCFLESEQEEYFAEFLYEDLLTGDFQAMSNWAGTLIDKGIAAPAEIRERFNFNPLPTGVGETPIVNGSYQLLSQVTAGQGRAASSEKPGKVPSDEQRDLPGDNEPLDDDHYASAGELARRFGLPAEPLRKRLERWRARSLVGFIRNPDAAGDPTQPTILYRIGSVRDVIAAAQASDAPEPASDV